MASCGCAPKIDQYGADPINIQWRVVRGNSAMLTVEFYDNDESTFWDIDGWEFKSTSYDPQGNVLDDLPVYVYDGYVVINVAACTTDNWGTKYSSIVAELQFDLRVTIPGIGTSVEDTIWTPIIGTICVLGNVTPGGSL